MAEIVGREHQDLSVLTGQEEEFVALVRKLPGAKLNSGEAWSKNEPDTYALWTVPENLGLIRAVGSYKWVPMENSDIDIRDFEKFYDKLCFSLEGSDDRVYEYARAAWFEGVAKGAAIYAERMKKEAPRAIFDVEKLEFNPGDVGIASQLCTKLLIELVRIIKQYQDDPHFAPTPESIGAFVDELGDPDAYMHVVTSAHGAIQFFFPSLDTTVPAYAEPVMEMMKDVAGKVLYRHKIYSLHLGSIVDTEA